MKTAFNFILLGVVLAICSMQSFVLSINGGRNARGGEIPHQLRLQYDGNANRLCGASLIRVGNKQAVVTAGHCTLGTTDPSEIEIIGGSVSISGETPNTQRRRASRVVSHSFNIHTLENNIALLALDQPFELNQFVNVINLPRLRQETTGVVVASGWGRTNSSTDDVSSTLQTVDIPVISNDQCGKVYSPFDFGIIQPSKICAGILGQGGKDTCQGDDGGPLRAKRGNYLAGVTSFEMGCGDGRYPGVYTRVSHYVDWIEQTVGSF